MNTSEQISKHLNQVFFGGNWTCSNYKDQLSDITLEEALKKVHDLNTIATLSFHISYYVEAILKVLEGHELNAHDKFSFDHPAFETEQEWRGFVDTVLQNVNLLTQLIDQLPESTLQEFFTNEKYGSYYRNLNGLIEHTHYHLGQISLIKKLIRNQ